MAGFHLGCAIWAYQGWRGDFYPPGSPSGSLLKLYSDRFSTVECNATFYAVPSVKTVTKWATETPEGFCFCPKLPQTITHQGALQPKIEAAKDFLALMDELGDRRGPIFAQLPPSYSPQYFQDLTQFLQGICDGSRSIGLEVRHPAWFSASYHQALTQLIQSLNVGQVLLDTRPVYQGSGNPQQHSPRKKPEVPLIPQVTAPFTLVRFISHPKLEENQQFMETWVPWIKTWLAQKIDVFFFMHCPVEERSPHHARHFQSLLRQHQIPVPDLPWNTVQPPPTQLDLFGEAILGQ